MIRKFENNMVINNNDYVIDLPRLLELLNAEAKLQCLESGDVDNWEWYDHAMMDFEEITEV